jgi:hypothetical protein
MTEPKKLGKRTRKILEDLAERIIPSGGPDYPGAHDLGLVDKILEKLEPYPSALRGLKALAWSWELAPLLFFKFQLFTWMKPEPQSRFLERCEQSRSMLLRWAVIGTKAMFMAAFYNRPLIWEKIGYEPGKCYQAVRGGGDK